MEKIINIFPILFWNVIDGDRYYGDTFKINQGLQR